MKYIERKATDKKEIIDLSVKTGLHPLIVKLLLMRNIDTENSIRAYIQSDIKNLMSPYKLSNIDKAKKIIEEIIEKKGKIVIYGDYDCDGIGAVAILYLTLKHLNADAHYYIPQRHDEGYGLNLDTIKKINDDCSPQLFITVDCGIKSVKETEYIKSLGIDIIITDHHEPANILPDTIIINPTLEKEYNPLCGAGVALKLAESLTSREYIKRFMDICAISTVADVVPLVGDNRIIVKEGLKILSSGKSRESLKKLLASTGIKKGNKITASDIAYRLAPRLNASGRLSSAYKSLKLLISDDNTEINLLIQELDKENKLRQDIFTEVLSQALHMLEGYDLSRNLIIVLKSDDWEEGVIGIAASKIVEQFNRPAILFTNNDGILKGSSRSINGINIYEVINSCKDILLKFGGHAMAAGLCINQDNFQEFIDRTNQYIKKNIDKDSFEKKLIYDEKICLNDMQQELINSLFEMEPYGSNNPRPVFICSAKGMNFKQIGNYPHIKAKKNSFHMLAFNKKYALPLLNSDCEKIISYTIDKDTYKNVQTVQCKIKDIYCEKTDIKDQVLFCKYLENFVYSGETTTLSKKTPSNKYSFGTLYVTFTNDAFNEFDDMDCERFVFNSETINPYNAVILSPEKDFIYTYYNKIIFIENPPMSLINHIKEKFTGTIESEGVLPKFSVEYDLSIELLRKDFLFFAKNLHGLKFVDINTFFQTAVSYNYTREFTAFCISFYIFNELHLLCVNNNGNIIINRQKVNLEQSEIYKWLIGLQE